MAWSEYLRVGLHNCHLKQLRMMRRTSISTKTNSSMIFQSSNSLREHSTTALNSRHNQMHKASEAMDQEACMSTAINHTDHAIPKVSA